MSVTDTSEKGLETLIVESLTGRSAMAMPEGTMVGDEPAAYGGAGYVQGNPQDYDRDHAVDLAKLFQFLQATQPKTVAMPGIGEDEMAAVTEAMRSGWLTPGLQAAAFERNRLRVTWTVLLGRERRN